MKISIIGAGNMGGSIVKGLVKSGTFKAQDITVTDVYEEALLALKKEFPKLNIAFGREAVEGMDVIIVAVKPWILLSVAQELRRYLTGSQIVVSIAAGISLRKLEQYFSTDREEQPVIFRAIPNTAISIGKSMTMITSSVLVEERQRQAVRSIFGALGEVMELDEKLFGAATSVASCGTAFALRYLRATMEGGIEMGLYPADAKRMAAQTIIGAMELVMHNGSHPEVEIDKVTTPGGITIKGLNAMEQNGFTNAVIQGLRASNIQKVEEE